MKEAVDRVICYDVHEALCESNYQAGLRAGWNLGLYEDTEGFARATAYTGYLEPILRRKKERNDICPG